MDPNPGPSAASLAALHYRQRLALAWSLAKAKTLKPYLKQAEDTEDTWNLFSTQSGCAAICA